MKRRLIEIPLILIILLAHASQANAQTGAYYIPPGVTNIRAMVTGGAESKRAFGDVIIPAGQATAMPAVMRPSRDG